MISIYTFEGFLTYSTYSFLKNNTTFNSNLLLYFVLIQASIARLSCKNNSLHLAKALNDQGTYILYRGSKISEKLLIEDSLQTKKNKSRFLVYNEFLSATHEFNIAREILNERELKEDLVNVLYILKFIKEIEGNPNLFCFIENMSFHPEEKEVLISSCSIFQIQQIIQKQFNSIYYYEVTLQFISNGFNSYDFIKYYTLEKINLKGNKKVNMELMQ